MIETSIEIRLFIISTLYINTTQIAIPFVMGSQLHAVKVPVGNFSLQVFLRSFYAGSWKSDLHHQFLSRFHIESGNDPFAFLCFSHRQVKRIYNRTVKLHHKKIVLINPYCIVDVSCQCLGIFPVHLTTIHLRVILFFSPGGSMLQVY